MNTKVAINMVYVTLFIVTFNFHNMSLLHYPLNSLPNSLTIWGGYEYG